MSGDASNARIWADADVYVAFDLLATVPADESTAFSAEWELVGLLDGDTGFGETRSEDETDHFAWGGILYATSRRNFILTRRFTAIEHNETTRRLRWPGSDGDEIRIPRPEQVLVGFETRQGLTTRRVITAGYAEITVDGDVTENEADPATLPFVARIFPDTTVSPARLFHVQPAEAISS